MVRNRNEIRRPDYQYWLKVKTWGTYEAACLILEVEPDSLPLRIGWLDEEPLSQVVVAKIQEVEKLRTILSSAADYGDFGKVRYGPEGETIHPPIAWPTLIRWVRRNGIEYSSNLAEAIAEFEKNPQEQDCDIDPRRETTLLRTIASLLHILRERTTLSEAELNREIRDLFGHIPGISKSQMEKDFADAKRRLADY